MHLGLAAWGFRETPLKKQLAITRKLGLRLLELSIAGCPNDALRKGAPPAEINMVKELFAESGIELSCAAGGSDFTLPDAGKNQRQLDDLKRMIDLGNKLGIKFLRIFAGFSPVDEVTGRRWEQMIACLCETVEYASGTGLVPVVETHGGVNSFPPGVKHFHSTSSEPAALLKILREVPGLNVNFDPANLFAAGVKHPEDVYLQIKDRVSYAHLKDFVPVAGTGCFLPAACGESRMNWHGLLDVMDKFHGPALIEYENVADVEAGCRRSLEFLYRMGVVNDDVR
ncbi:MAG: sugar phosphate isomerase/epimerase family protein [Victivallaceae bacterium]|jgi:sugar phosphate isomerase/epimerase